MYSTGKRDIETISECISQELDLFEKAYKEEFQRGDAVLLPVLEYVGKEKGKCIRPSLFFLCQGLINKPKLTSIPVAVLLELLHIATLVHDDVVDQSVTRRGKDTLNALWGDNVSVLLGDYLLAKVLALGVSVPWTSVLSVISRAVMGMGKEELRQVLETPEKKFTITNYLRNIHGKTAGFMSASSELGGIVMEADNTVIVQLRRLGTAFGMAFQIRDDILDITGSEDILGKPVGQDMANGKITLPLILALEQVPTEEKEKVLQRQSAPKSKNGMWIREFIERYNGVQLAQQKAEIFINKALQILMTFPSSVYRDALQKIIVHDLERMG
ncbi:polyprenyl synthetase family protein [bacterium]